MQDVPLDALADAPLVYVTGTGLCREPSRSTVLGVLERRPAGPKTRMTQSVTPAGTPFELDPAIPQWADAQRQRNSDGHLGRKHGVRPAIFWIADAGRPGIVTMAIDRQGTGLALLRICLGVFFIFEGLGKTKRYSFLYRIADAKRPQTRAKRIAEYVELLAEGKTLG